MRSAAAHLSAADAGAIAEQLTGQPVVVEEERHVRPGGAREAVQGGRVEQPVAEACEAREDVREPYRRSGSCSGRVQRRIRPR